MRPVARTRVCFGRIIFRGGVYNSFETGFRDCGGGVGGMHMVCKTSCNFSVKNKLFPVIMIFIACDLYTHQ
jgi:hypothetical protein